MTRRNPAEPFATGETPVRGATLPRMPRRGLRVAIAGAVLVPIAALLGACTAAPPQATAPPSPTADAATSTPTSSDPGQPDGTISAIVARPEWVELRDATGAVVDEFGYLDDPAEVVSAFSELLGTTPSTEDHEGNSHFPPNTSYRWEGLVLWEQRHVDRWEPVGYSITNPRFLIEFTGPSAVGVELTTQQGIQAGDPWSDLLSEPGLVTNPTGCSGPYVDFVELTGVNVDGGAYSIPIAVDFRPTADDARVARVGAPVPATEECA
ncbi:hypothetical protein [Agromyces kandeliae]|uniref:Uncharacterized protein n=1 Tax=Agromyces kandeliae TaxID=2666141 RepID=A0A6L5QYA1_9MICO|nr:hypothetical protein [Agromyces kandeliae]MRX42741.1 hypothetical protein [Agromyces kandeliae]